MDSPSEIGAVTGFRTDTLGQQAFPSRFKQEKSLGKNLY